MTTAHRPTWATAQGGGGKYDKSSGFMSKQTSVLDMPAHTKLKYRDDIDEKTSDDLKAELENRETKHFFEVRKAENKKKGIAAITSDIDDRKDSRREEPKRAKLLKIQVDPNDVDLKDDDHSESSDSDSEDDDDDDTAELLAELQKIKKERAEEQARKEEKIAEQDARIRLESIVKGNPLLNDGQTGDFTVNRRWDEDTVFKNCARGDMEAKKVEAECLFR
eukprot:gene3858-6355_t